MISELKPEYQEVAWMSRRGRIMKKKQMQINSKLIMLWTLQSLRIGRGGWGKGSPLVKHREAGLESLNFTLGEGNGNPLVFLPGESQGRWSLMSCHLWVRTVGHDWSDLAAAAGAPFSGYQLFFTPGLKLPICEMDAVVAVIIVDLRVKTCEVLDP